MKQTIISQGAEAIIIKKGVAIIKERIKKSYRLPILDERLRKQRTKRESSILEKVSKLIPVPKLIKTDDKENIEMSFIDGLKLSESMDKMPNALDICKTIGKQIAILHDNNIIHGDLTTSNMILSNKDKKLYFIDFGLSFHSPRAEDKAVDLHLIKQALEAKHFSRFQAFFSAIKQGYKTSKHSSQVLKRLENVESRGRYKQSY